jgi:ketosteroid isomerase-like protein
MNKLIFFIIILLTYSCIQDSETSVEDLFNVDREFSVASESEGYNKAFIKYAHDEAVLLRDNNLPLKGKAEITRVFEAAKSENVSFTWQPSDGNIAKSGDLGYTYGTYQFKKDTVVEVGTYVSIWKKDANGNWKYILDSGNEGLGEN